MTDQDWFSHVEDELDSEELHRRAEELEGIGDVLPDEDGLIVCPVLPLREVIVFPRMVVPLPVGRSSSLLAIEEAQANNQVMISIPQRDPKRHHLRIKDFLPVGVVVVVSEVFSTDVVKNMVMVQGRQRVKIVDFISEGPVLYARGQVVDEASRPSPQEDALMRNIMRLFESYT